MQEAAPSLFGAWESFYVIVGSSAGALTGLQFVVISLIRDAWRTPSSNEVSAFATPTMLHFCVVLLVAATLSAPWPALAGPQLLLGVCGVAGMAYEIVVAWRATHSLRYHMVLEDWMFHVVFPAIAYFALAAAALALRAHVTVGLFTIGGASLLLLFVGIHNAWDTATYVASGRAAAEAKAQEDSDTAAPRAEEPATSLTD